MLQSNAAQTKASEATITPAQSPRLLRPQLLRPKTVVFALIAVMTAYVIAHNERFLLDPNHPVWQHYATFKWWLLPHGIAGA